MAEHHLKAGPETCHWGFFDSELAPVLEVASGDRVVIDTVSGNARAMPGPGFEIPPALDRIMQTMAPTIGPHILTGPVRIAGAKPGQVLEVRILDVELTTDWGYNLINPISGTLPYEFKEFRAITIPLDRERMVGRLPWGLDLKLSPFFGIMGLAPPQQWGRITSIVPRSNCGNLDNKELVAGSTLYMPIHHDGALFSCGDGHGTQGDGEVCVTAIETSLRGTFEFILRDDLTFTYPRAETPTHYITMGMDPDLDQCAMMALRDMIALLGEKGGLSREDAYTLCSLAGDLRVTQTVNTAKGIHMMMAKSLVHPQG